MLGFANDIVLSGEKEEELSGIVTTLRERYGINMDKCYPTPHGRKIFLLNK